MKAAVSSIGNDLNSPVDERFGRAKYFVLVDTDTGSLLKVVDNSINANAESGAGISAAQALCDAGVNVVITGHVGPKAFQALSAAGIEMYNGATDTVTASVDSYKAGKLVRATQDSAMGARGRGMGRGGGRGQGGGGRGQGGGGNRGGGR